MTAAPRSGPGRRRLGGIRLRTTLGAVGVVGVGLLAGTWLLVAAMRDTLLDDIEAVTRLRAQEIAAGLEAGERPALAVAEADEQLVQIVDGDGIVLASSANVSGDGPVTDLAAGGSERIRTPVDDDEFIAVAVGADGAPGAPTVLVARSVEDVLESTEVVTRLLAVAAPLLLLLVGATTWTVVGRALAPVERIRSEVEEISTTELHRRVTGPATNDEIERLATTMNQMLERLDRGQARQRRFVADASHELRSPVASIRQHAEVARLHPARTSVDDLAVTVLAEALRLQRLVDDLLVLARADERSLRPVRDHVDLDDLVLAEAGRLRTETDLRIDTRQVSASRVDGDVHALRRVVRNLADNAARHARTTVALGLRTDQHGDAVLVVDDDGDGIPEAERERVFERFVRIDEGRDRGGGGTGLGLPIVRELVSAHGGSVTASTSDLGGARLTVRLPGAVGGPT